MNPTKPLSCPYQDGECPHIQEVRDDVKEDIEKLDRKLDRMNQLLYVIAGVITIACGVSLW